MNPQIEIDLAEFEVILYNINKLTINYNLSNKLSK